MAAASSPAASIIWYGCGTSPRARNSSIILATPTLCAASPSSPTANAAPSGGDDKTLRVGPAAGCAGHHRQSRQSRSQGETAGDQGSRPVRRRGQTRRAPAHQVPGSRRQLVQAAGDRPVAAARRTPGREDVLLLATMASDKSFPEGRLYAVEALATLGADAKPALKALEEMLKEKDLIFKAQGDCDHRADRSQRTTRCSVSSSNFCGSRRGDSEGRQRSTAKAGPTSQGARPGVGELPVRHQPECPQISR